MDVNNLNACISHEEATIRSYIRDPAFAEFMLQDAINDGDISEIRKIQRRIDEAKSRSYWNALIQNAERTAKNGNNIQNVIQTVKKALNILSAAVPASA